MKIILVGGGKVGTALARQLSEEDHNVTIVDTNKARVEHLTESYDVLGDRGQRFLDHHAGRGRALKTRMCSLP